MASDNYCWPFYLKIMDIPEIFEDKESTVYILDIYKYLDKIIPPKGIDLDPIDPGYYFITSGDALCKMQYLEKIIWKHAGEVRRLVYRELEKERKISPKEAYKLYRSGIRPRKNKKLVDYEKFVWEQAGFARKLTNRLKKIKGNNCFLETEWNNHVLYCCIKNPRKPKDNITS